MEKSPTLTTDLIVPMIDDVNGDDGREVSKNNGPQLTENTARHTGTAKTTSPGQPKAPSHVSVVFLG